mmetsp:Transcript_28667/g.51256  ORF Transcript_28667/g.51256 Transcript_28667/m.51256 type:complete len:205 (-) Transcript_28667:295-909(-)
MLNSASCFGAGGFSVEASMSKSSSSCIMLAYSENGALGMRRMVGFVARQLHVSRKVRNSASDTSSPFRSVSIASIIASTSSFGTSSPMDLKKAKRASGVITPFPNLSIHEYSFDVSKVKSSTELWSLCIASATSAQNCSNVTVGGACSMSPLTMTLSCRPRSRPPCVISAPVRSPSRSVSSRRNTACACWSLILGRVLCEDCMG